MKRRRGCRSHQDEDEIDERRNRRHVARAIRRHLVARAATASEEARDGRTWTVGCLPVGSSGSVLANSTVGRLERGWDPRARYLSYALGTHDACLCGRNLGPLRLS